MTFTNVPFSVAAPIIGAAAMFEDEISAQMKTTENGKRTETAVMTVGLMVIKNAMPRWGLVKWKHVQSIKSLGTTHARLPGVHAA